MHSFFEQHPIGAIIFDHDGTLVDSESIHLKCWQIVLHSFGCELDASTYTNNLNGLPSLASAQWIRDRFQLDIPAEQLLHRKVTCLSEHLEDNPFPLCPGARDVVIQLAAKYPLAVASGASLAEVSRSLQAHRLDAFFRAICTKDHVSKNKPSPEVYLLAAEKLGVPPSHCLAIEDSDTGLKAALAAQMPCLRLSSSQPSTKGEQWAPINQLSDIIT